jgi:hypothetical protein
MFNELTEALKAEDIAAENAVKTEQDIHEAISEHDEVEELASVFDELDNDDVFDSDLNADVENVSSMDDDIDCDDDDDCDSDDILEESGGVISWIMRHNSVSGYNDLVGQIEVELSDARTHSEIMKIRNDIESYTTEMREVIRSDFSRGFKHYLFWFWLIGVPGLVIGAVTKYFKEQPAAKAKIKAALVKLEGLLAKADKKLASVKESVAAGNADTEDLGSLNESDLHDLFIIK